MTKIKLKLIAIVFVFAGIAGAVFYFQMFPPLGRDTPVAVVSDASFGWKFPVAKFPSTGSGEKLAYSDIRDPGGIPQGLPVRLIIPLIGVDSAIEDALITPDGRMDVPAGSINVAWFSLGPSPGQIGSAVIGGHFGIRNGIPFVFYDLDKLRIGDKIHIVDDRGDTLAFVVRSIRLFDRNADATAVFTSNDGLAHLNLITCEGVWNRVNDNYPERRVVFTDAIPKEAVAPIAPTSGAGITKAEDIATFYRSIGIGAEGADVVALQTILQQKGFLTMPPGVAYGFFGPLTRAAIAKYQVSAGLPSVGIFGPLTRAKLITELGGDTGLPNTALGSVSPIPVPEQGKIATPRNVEKLPPSLQALSQSIKSLYATPMDGLITSFLFISIVFMAFKIIRRFYVPNKSIV